MAYADYNKHKPFNVINVTKLVTVHYFEFHKDFKNEGEKHDFWELVYIDKGEVTVTAGKKEITLKQGDIIFHKPNEFHNIRANGIIAPNVFIISFNCSSPAIRHFENKYMKLPVKLKTLISFIIDESRKAFDLPRFDPYMKELKVNQNAPIGAQQMVKLYLEQLLILLIRKDESKHRSVILPKEVYNNPVVVEMIEFLEKNIYGTVCIDDICEHTNYGKTYIYETFKRNTGYSPIQYYNILKITEAKKLIREGLQFSDISNVLCFDNPHYFTRIFKRITSMTPKEYRNSVKID